MILLHGTTLKRAEAILRNGPDLDFIEPNGYSRAQGFSTAPEGGTFVFGDPETIAHGKAEAFPEEGGPAILARDVPDDVAQLGAYPGGDEFRFEPGYGFEELTAIWQTISKWLVQL